MSEKTLEQKAVEILERLEQFAVSDGIELGAEAVQLNAIIDGVESTAFLVIFSALFFFVGRIFLAEWRKHWHDANEGIRIFGGFVTAGSFAGILINIQAVDWLAIVSPSHALILRAIS